MVDDVVYVGLDTLRALLTRHRAALGYVILDEVLHRHHCEPIARLNITDEDLRPWQADEAADPEGDDDEDITDEPTEEGEDDEDDDGPGELADLGLGDAPDPMPAAVLRWVRATLAPIMAPRPRGTFKLRLYRPKGDYIVSSHFKAENPNYRPARPSGGPPEAGSLAATAPAPEPTPAAPPAANLPALAPPAPVPPPPLQVVLPAELVARRTPAVALALGGDGPGQLLYLDPDTIPEARVWRALGQATEDLLRRSGAAYGNIIELQSRTVVHQAEQLDKSQRLVENLAVQLLAARQVQQSDEASLKADEQQLRIREELGKTFLSELGSFGRLLASTRLGVPPEFAELGDLISTSPELAEAIRDPNVRAMLKDDKTRRELAQLLLIAAKKPNTSGPEAA